MCNKLPYSNPRIDPCMRELCKAINTTDLKTLASCCGHGTYPPTIVVKRAGRIFEFYSGITLGPRKRNRYYKRDKNGFYYIPEVMEEIILSEKICQVCKKPFDDFYFIERTTMHIDLVRKYLKKIRDNHTICIDREIIKQEMIIHDLTKFQEPELTPYVWITLKYRDNLPNSSFTAEQQLQMQHATEHHVKQNKHHPEYWTSQTDTINFIDRDKPKSLVDATKMPLTYVACMVADWMAVAEERRTNPFEWAKNNINIRWEFTKIQEDLIYKLLETHWRRKE